MFSGVLFSRVENFVRSILGEDPATKRRKTDVEPLHFQVGDAIANLVREVAPSLEYEACMKGHGSGYGSSRGRWSQPR